MTSIRHTIEYQAISDFYGSQTAKRSGVLLTQHIDDGIVILESIGADSITQAAFCLHPIFQMDDALVTTATEFMRVYGIPQSAFLAMEYRGIANAYLAYHVMPRDGIRLGPLSQVHQMLVADKVQNRKDFDLYHKAGHPNSERLTQYFNEWLTALGVSEARYQELISELD